MAVVNALAYISKICRSFKLETLFTVQVPVVSWFDDVTDRELLDLIPFFENLAKIDDVYMFLNNANLPISQSLNPVTTIHIGGNAVDDAIDNDGEANNVSTDDEESNPDVVVVVTSAS